MEFLNNLNEQQKIAVTEKHQRICVIAGPGCGKTRTLISRAMYLINHEKISLSQILIVTFAKKAIKEIKRRIALQLNIFNKSELNIYNFHSFCYHILQDYAVLLGFPEGRFPVYDRHDQEEIIKKIINDLDYNHDQKEVGAVLSFIANCKNGWDFDPLYLEEIDKKRYEIYQKYQEYLQENKAMDFSDLLLYTIKLFQEQPQVREKYQKQFKHILVDEVQDINKIQFSILEQITNLEQNLFLVGDPNQSIYGFQGSTPKLISSLIEKKEWLIIYLNINYRSTGNIISLANSFIQKNDKTLINNPLSITREKGRKVRQISQVPLRSIIRQLSWLMIREKLQFNDVAILYRNNYLSMRIEQELIAQKIPYEILGAFKFIKREEIKDVLAFLRTIVYQDNLSLLRILKLNEGIGARTLEKIIYNSEKEKITIYNYLHNYSNLIILEKEQISSKQKKILTEFIFKINETVKETLLKKEKLQNFIQKILERFDYWNHLKDKNNHREKEKNVRQLLNVAETWENKQKKEIIDTRELIEAFLRYFLIAFEDRKLIKTRNNLILSSIHQSKGLEFKAVFLAYCEENILPYKDSKDLTEERRLFYVAITRAKNHLFLITGLNPSLFLEEIDKNYLEKEGK